MNWKNEWKTVVTLTAGFLLLFWLPVGRPRFDGAVLEAFHLAKWYAREHVLLCVVTALFIAGAIGVFVSQAAVMRYLGARAHRVLAYGVASVSGTVLAVCSCTVLPLFAGIYRMGAGLGPACTFLYAGPAINVLAISLTARVLGVRLGVARAVGAVLFSVVIGLLMQLIFRREEAAKLAAAPVLPEPEARRPLWQNGLFFAVLAAILVLANWGGCSCLASGEARLPPTGLAAVKWPLVGALGLVLAWMLVRWLRVCWWKVLAAVGAVALLAMLFPRLPLVPFSGAAVALAALGNRDQGEAGEWVAQSWGFAKQILPLLLAGVLVAGFLLGRPGHEGLIPGRWVEILIGARPDTFLAAAGLNGSAAEAWVRPLWPLWTNLFASVFGAFMYFATLTEVPILQGLLGAGMGQGPALALLLAGPALSLPSMLVLRSILGTRKAAVFVLLVVVMATVTGLLFGLCFD